MQLKKKLPIGVTVGLLVVGGTAFAADPKCINFLTGGQSVVYYPVGVALAQIFGKAIPDARSTAQVTKASAENLNLLQPSHGELAMSLGDAVVDAW